MTGKISSTGKLELMIDSFQGRHRIICAFREVARAIVKKHNLIANVDEILFIIDQSAEKAARTASDISKIPPLWSDVIYQLTFRQFAFVIKFINVNLDVLSTHKNAFQALVYHELKHIKKNEKTGELYLDKTHDIEDWHELAKFGDWENDDAALSKLPDLMTCNICTKEIA